MSFGRALNDVFAAESDDAWRGYTGEQEDGTIDLTSRALFETAIARLRDAVVDTGGRYSVALLFGHNIGD